jgi:hypothetical protein
MDGQKPEMKSPPTAGGRQAKRPIWVKPVVSSLAAACLLFPPTAAILSKSAQQQGSATAQGVISVRFSGASYPPLTAPAVNPATIWRCANTVSTKTGKVTSSAAAASGPQLNWSKEIML